MERSYQRSSRRLNFSNRGGAFPFGVNLAIGTVGGALTGCIDAALNGNNIWTGIWQGGVSGAIFATLTSENFSNLTNGKGFYNNQTVFDNFKNGKYSIPNGSSWQQETLNYFGFEGTYDPNKPHFLKNGGYGYASPKTGEIFYNKATFDNGYDYLAFTADHEWKHSQNVLSGKYNGINITDEIFFQEEINTYLYNYKNQGLYLGFPSIIDQINQNMWNLDIIRNTNSKFIKKRSDFIFKIPRKW